MVLQNKYFVRKSASAAWEDVVSMYDGVRVLSISGFNEKGKALNVYTAQWVDSQTEDFQIVSDSATPVVIRENANLEVTFIVSKKYASNAIDVQTQHDNFVAYMTNGDLYVKSAYTNKEVRCVCLESYKPTTEKLHRGMMSYIIGTIKLHMLDVPSVSQQPQVGDVYIGFGLSTLGSMSDITSLNSLQHYSKEDAAGEYTITNTTTSYLWVCSDSVITAITSSGFYVPFVGPTIIGSLRCFRSTNAIKPHTMTFTIITT